MATRTVTNNVMRVCPECGRRTFQKTCVYCGPATTRLNPIPSAPAVPPPEVRKSKPPTGPRWQALVDPETGRRIINGRDDFFRARSECHVCLGRTWCCDHARWAGKYGNITVEAVTCVCDEGCVLADFGEFGDGPKCFHGRIGTVQFMRVGRIRRIRRKGGSK